MSKLRALTYGVGGGYTPAVPSELLEWTDDDRIVFHGSLGGGPSGWNVSVADLTRVGGWMSRLTLVPREADPLHVWFTDPIVERNTIGQPEHYGAVKRSGITTWVERLEAEGIPSSYLSTKTTYVFGIAGVLLLTAVILIVTIVVVPIATRA